MDNRTDGQRFRDTLTFRGTGEVPIWAGFSQATWIEYGDALIDIIEKYPSLGLDKKQRGIDHRAKIRNAFREYEDYNDYWGCVWHCIRDGMEGQISYHPLADISSLKDYKAPDPLKYAERNEHDWEELARKSKAKREKGELVSIAGERFFERVHFLRGMEDALADMALGTPEIQKIVDLVLEYNLAYLEHALTVAAPVDIVGFGDDWGCQDRCIISPAAFRKYFKPGYTKMYQLCKRHGALTTQHSDGYTVELWDEFLEAGLTAFNMQVNCIGVDLIEKRLKGRMCIIADIDRQHILPIGTPAQVRDHIAEVVTRLGSPKGGLVMRIDVYPDVSLENIDALLAAVVEFKDYWVGR